MKNAEYVAYRIPISCGDHGDCEFIYTREKPQAACVSSAGLLSNIHHGVDNTGNVCVWTAESILLYTLLTNTKIRDTITDKKILELGGGLTGLCGLGLAATQIANCIVVTDGHPDCVANQKVCIQMNVQKGSIDMTECPISSHLLRWQIGDPNKELESIASGGNFDVIIASDCLFFKDFHDDLIFVLQNALVPTGVVYLLQPRRGTTMELFIAKASTWFEIEISEDYSDKVSSVC
jgi:calmodulin-lysine N-methyltransferase